MAALPTSLWMSSYDDIHSTSRIAVFLTVATSVLLLMKRLKTYLEQKKPFANLPMPANSHWLLGHLPYIRGPFQEFLQTISVDYANDHGHTGYWMGPRPMMVVTNWQDARKVYLNETHRKRVPVFSKHLEAVSRYNILSLMGREWKVQRTAIARAFQTTYNTQYRSVMVQVVDDLVGALKNKLHDNPGSTTYDVHMETVMKMCSLDIFALASMGVDLGSCRTFEQMPLADDAEFLNKEFLRRARSPLNPFAYFYCLPCESNRKFHKAANTVRSYFHDQIKQRQQLAEEAIDKNEANMDLFARLVKGHALAQKEMPGIVPDDALLDLVIAVMFAGYETTAVNLCYAFYLLDKHPEMQDLCVEEIRSLGDKTLDDPKELLYCEAVILEALRLYPAAVISSRTIQKPMELSGGYVAAKGTTILLPIWILNRNPKTWPQPESFRPDRWVVRRNQQKTTTGKGTSGTSLWVEREESDTTSSSIPPANRKAMFTFSAGGRSCPGSSFAMQEAVLVLAGLLRHFKFTTPKGYETVPIREGITQHPKDGIPMKVQLRS